MSEASTEGREMTKPRAKGDLSISKGKHTRLCNQVLTATKDLSSDNEYVRSLIYRMDSAFDDLYEKFSIYLEMFELEDNQGEIDKNTDLHEVAIQEHFKFMKQAVNPPLSPLVTDTSADSNKKSNDSQTTITSSLKVVLPDMKPFSGKIRDYPNFKTTFRDKYERHYGELGCVILRDKLLSDRCAKTCKSLNSVDAIFEKLDKSYGDPGKMVEAVLADVRKIKVCKKDNLDDLQNLVQVIEEAETDLSGVKLVHHIKQYHTVSIITEKLPLDMQKRWALEIATNDIKTDKRYSKILEFLNLEIQTLELMGSTLDETSVSVIKANVHLARNDDLSSGEHTCLLHPDMSNHPLWRCRTLRNYSISEQVHFFKTNENVCRSCLEIHTGSCQKQVWLCQNFDCNARHYTFLHDACVTLEGH